MADSDNLKIFKKSYDFAKWMFDHTNKFPKSHRFSIAVRIENLLMELLEIITTANYRIKKLPLLIQADELLIKLRVLTRFSHEKRFINTGSYEYAARELTEIGKLLGGWIKSQR